MVIQDGAEARHRLPVRIVNFFPVWNSMLRELSVASINCELPTSRSERGATIMELSTVSGVDPDGHGQF